MDETEKKVQRSLGTLRWYAAVKHIGKYPVCVKVEATSRADADSKVLLKLNSKQRRHIHMGLKNLPLAAFITYDK